MARKDRFSDKGKPQQPRRVAERAPKPLLLIVCGGQQTVINLVKRLRDLQ